MWPACPPRVTGSVSAGPRPLPLTVLGTGMTLELFLLPQFLTQDTTKTIHKKTDIQHSDQYTRSNVLSCEEIGRGNRVVDSNRQTSRGRTRSSRGEWHQRRQPAAVGGQYLTMVPGTSSSHRTSASAQASLVSVHHRDLPGECLSQGLPW